MLLLAIIAILFFAGWWIGKGNDKDVEGWFRWR